MMMWITCGQCGTRYVNLNAQACPRCGRRP